MCNQVKATSKYGLSPKLDTSMNCCVEHGSKSTFVVIHIPINLTDCVLSVFKHVSCKYSTDCTVFCYSISTEGQQTVQTHMRLYIPQQHGFWRRVEPCTTRSKDDSYPNKLSKPNWSVLFCSL
jgi:hypothetical protein